MKLTIHGPNLTDQSKGTFHVHTSRCRDNKVEVAKNGSVDPITVEIKSLMELVELHYADQMREADLPQYQSADAYVDDFHIAPCVKGLPYGDPVHGQAAPEPEPAKPAKLTRAQKDAAIAQVADEITEAVEPKPKATTKRANVNVAKSGDAPKALMTRATKAAVKEHADAARYPRKSRTSGTTVAIFDNRENQLIVNDSPWFAVCVDHGALLPAANIGAASDWQPHAARWCPDCQQNAA
jgi:hypothetical protein